MRRLRQLRRQVGQEVTQQLVVTLTMSRLHGLLQHCAGGTAKVHTGATSLFRMQLLDWWFSLRSLRPRHAKHNPAPLHGCQSATESSSNSAV